MANAGRECQSCGHKVRAKAKFCEACGAALSQKPVWQATLRTLQDIIDALPHPIYLKDTQGKYLLVNEAMAEHHGMSVEAFRGFPTAKLPNRSKKEIAAILKADREVVKKGKRVDIPEIEVHLAQGRTGWEHMVKVPLKDEAGKVFAIAGVATDITRHKEIEASLVRAKEEAVEATEVKDKFVSLIAHDLRSPIATVLGMLAFLEPGAQHVDDGRQKEIYDQTVLRLNGMVRLIESVLDISRMRTGKIQLKKQFHPAFELILPAMSLNHTARDKGVELVNEVPDDLELEADSIYFALVVQNLVSNAIKFCKAGDRISISAPAGQPATIAVRDTGVGIPKERLADIFRYDVKTTTLGTDGEPGTGLGLPLCHDIMLAHGGELRVESREGSGSTFYAQLPA